MIGYQIEKNLCEVNLLEKIYVDTAKILKALSEPKRLRIIDMLSCGELCACEILEEFHITQPTLSHDMKLLVETGMVQYRRGGKNIYYSLNQDVLQELQETLKTIFTSNLDCICHSKSDGGCK
jgi:ArsR family transcriptional regulator